MISIIVPVYNVEPYLRTCLDSVISQTYRELEILVIDDGSTDGSGAICDEYGEKDNRIRVIHTENKGLSCARNLGLDNAHGEWIGFVDSDDWIEPDMYEVLLRRAEETGADISECGCYMDFSDSTNEIHGKNATIAGNEACHALLHDGILDSVWNKIYKKHCFEQITFPEGRINEDIATTYKLLMKANKVCTIEECKYHYIQRDGSLSKVHKMKYLLDFWIANRERYDALVDKVDKSSKRELLRYCASAAGRTWAYFYDCTKKERKENLEIIREICCFTRSHIPLLGYSEWDVLFRVGVFFPHFLNNWSFRVAHLLNKNKRIILWRKAK